MVNYPAVVEALDPRFGLFVSNSSDSLKAGIEKLLLEPNLLIRYRENISQSFHKEELYEARLDEICSLLELNAFDDTSNQRGD